MRLREPLNVTILNKIEVKHQQLFIVLFGNPFIDAMESKRKTLNVDVPCNEYEVCQILQ